jgi:hypothetical protein
MFRKTNTKAARAVEAQPVSPTRKLADERDLMRSRRASIEQAERVIAEYEAKVRRFEAIISDAAAADQALQAAVAGDGGQSLQAFANGETAPDSNIATLVGKAESTSRAAVVARAALPTAQAELSNARAQIDYLQQLHHESVRVFMTALANEVGREYQRTYKELTEAYDALRGISDALPPLLATESAIAMSGQPLQVPNFNLPSVRDGSEWIETKRYNGNEHKIQAAAGTWHDAFQQLLRDPGASVDHLLGSGS